VILEYGFTELEYGFNELCIVYRIACEIFFLRIPRGKKLGPPLMTSADVSCIKEGILIVGKEYSILKEDMEENECG
jgi:hypothetical protein